VRNKKAKQLRRLALALINNTKISLVTAYEDYQSPRFRESSIGVFEK